MNATHTLEQAMLSLDSVNPCNFLVLYEDAAMHGRATEFCARMEAHFGPELEFAFGFWEVHDLADPITAHWAAEAGARADILLLVMQTDELLPEVMNWLEMRIAARTKTEGALALMLAAPPGEPARRERLLTRLQLAAYRLRMDFLPLLPSGSEMSPALPAEASLVLSDHTVEEPLNSHWGLNE